MAKRTYDQPTCGLATALDLLGERWTLLIVRELMLGPQRYSDLQERSRRCKHEPAGRQASPSGGHRCDHARPSSSSGCVEGV